MQAVMCESRHFFIVPTLPGLLSKAKSGVLVVTPRHAVILSSYMYICYSKVSDATVKVKRFCYEQKVAVHW